MEKHNFIGAEDWQAKRLRNSTYIIGLDDIANTLMTVNRMGDVAVMSGYPKESPIQYFVIGTEAQWDPQGLHYPKIFPPNVHAFFQIPEVIGDLP